jgi:hypothetical protein
MNTRNDPIEFVHEDQLGRASTAKVFARALLENARRPMIAAVFGPWGSGKTSFANLLSAELRGQGAQCKWFNPWQFTNQEALTFAFFDMLACSLGLAGPELEAARDKFNRYASAVTSPTRPVPAGGLFSSRPEVPLGLPIPEQRDQLTRLFGACLRPIIVFIDDVDRLFSQDIRLLIQLVKSNADFPNLKFVLLFQKETVEAALRTDGQPGADFLEKIIEVPVELPLIRSRKYVDDLLREVSILFGDLAKLDGKDSERWHRLLDRGLFENFTTLRQKNRLLDRLHLHKWNLESGLGINVNLVDLLALEVLRAVDYEAYNLVRKLGPGLTESTDDLRATRYKAAARAFIDALDRELGQGETAAAEHSVGRMILLDLFPCLSEGSRPDPVEEERSYRICRSRHFPKYFFEGLFPEEMNKVGRRRLELAVELGVGLLDLLSSFEHHGLLLEGLEYLTTIAPTIRPESWTVTAVDLGVAVDRFGRDPDRTQGRLIVPEAERALRSMLSPASPQDRGSVLNALVEHPEALQITGVLLHPGSGFEAEFGLNNWNERRVQRKFCRSIEASAYAGTLESLEDFGNLLLIWKAYAPRAAQNFVRIAGVHPERFAGIVRGLARTENRLSGVTRDQEAKVRASVGRILGLLPHKLAVSYTKAALEALAGRREEKLLLELEASLGSAPDRAVVSAPTGEPTTLEQPADVQ